MIFNFLQLVEERKHLVFLCKHEEVQSRGSNQGHQSKLEVLKEALTTKSKVFVVDQTGAEE